MTDGDAAAGGAAGTTADRFDVAIIGGGALGSATAWEASSRGLRTALIEREDFGAATSASSLRIVHGGLRYLQKMDLRRARRSVAERSAFLKIAPHLVAPLRCVIPTLAHWMRGRTALAAGLSLNALLSADRNRGLDAERRLPAGGLLPLEEFAALAPGIPTGGWTGGAAWYDAVMLEPERLCLAFVQSARQHGARVWNHTEVCWLRRAGRQENALGLVDRLSGSEREIRARIVIDCRGLAAPSSPGDGPGSAPTASVRAVNLVLDGPAPGCAVGFPARDEGGRPSTGRLFFALPFHGRLAVGTWYFPGPGGQADDCLLPGELDQILAELRASTDWAVTADAVRMVHLGHLPPANGQAADVPADRPLIFREPDCEKHVGLWRLCTEKWTTVRGLAERAVDEIARRESLPDVGPSVSRSRPLHGAGFESLAALRRQARSRRPGIVGDTVIDRLTGRYGEHALGILEQIAAEPALAEPMPGFPDVTRGEVVYAATEEMALTLPDLVLRRLGLGAAGCPGAESLGFAADLLGERLGWSPDERAANIGSVQSYRSFRVV